MTLCVPRTELAQEIKCQFADLKRLFLKGRTGAVAVQGFILQDDHGSH